MMKSAYNTQKAKYCYDPDMAILPTDHLTPQCTTLGSGMLKNIVLVLLAIASIFLMPKVLSRPGTARQILKQQGYTNIEITGWRPFMAGGDKVSTGFEATSPSGERVSGAVTGGLFFKGSTVRFD